MDFEISEFMKSLKSLSKTHSYILGSPLDPSPNIIIFKMGIANYQLFDFRFQFQIRFQEECTIWQHLVTPYLYPVLMTTIYVAIATAARL